MKNAFYGRYANGEIKYAKQLHFLKTTEEVVQNMQYDLELLERKNDKRQSVIDLINIKLPVKHATCCHSCLRVSVKCVLLLTVQAVYLRT